MLGTRCLCSSQSGSLSWAQSAPAFPLRWSTNHRTSHDAALLTIFPRTSPWHVLTASSSWWTHWQSHWLSIQHPLQTGAPRWIRNLETLLWLSLPCMTIAYQSPKQGAPPHSLGVPTCWPSTSASLGKARGANISALICLSPPAPTLPPTLHQQRIRISPTCPAFINAHSRLMVNPSWQVSFQYCGRISV